MIYEKQGYMEKTRKKTRRIAKKSAPRTKRAKTRVTVDFPPDEHKRLKAIAALQGVTLQDLIVECVNEKMHKPNAKTIEMIRKAERGEGLVECKDFDDFIKKIGLD
ncbi:MAG: hypothetical protein HYZ48_00950 [Chlamydiales bacterium]|nr:hypothetical protein [Chlamydiales bacterium]